MRWPWSKTPRIERRQSGGDFYDLVLAQIEAQAAGQAAASSLRTAAVEAASGALSRAFASAMVEGPDWVQESVTPGVLGQIGRDLIRKGDSMHRIMIDLDGMVKLIPVDQWYWEGGHDPASWTVRATAYGPSTSATWHLSASAVVFVRWGSSPGTPYVGTGPTTWASLTAKLQSETERSLADEAGGPIAQLLAIPQDGGEDDADDSLAPMKAGIAKARGKAVLLETTNAGWGDGKVAAPQRDWVANRLGPKPPEAMAMIQKQSFEAVLAACGCPPSLFVDSDGTAQREAVRRWHLGTVMPLARIVEHELSDKLDTPVKLVFDNYPLDLAGRAQAFQKLVAGGVAVNEALVTSGLMAADE